MKNKIISITKKYNDLLFILFIIAWIGRHRVSWMEYVAHFLIILYVISIVLNKALDYKHSRLFLALRGGEKWRRFKRMYRTQLLTERIFYLMLVIVIGTLLVGIAIKN